VDLCLRQVERGLPFNVPGTHIVAGGVADDLASGIVEKGQLRFRHRPLRIRPNSDWADRATYSPPRRLKEELRPFGGVHAIVKVAASRIFALFDSSAATAEVGNAGGPDLLAHDRGKDTANLKPFDRRADCRGLDPALQVSTAD